MLVFGGRTGDTDNTTVNTGSSYDPVSNTWTALSSSNAPAPREYHTAVWTGTEMIIWGGYDGTKSTGVTTGGRYNPQTNTWQATIRGLEPATGGVRARMTAPAEPDAPDVLADLDPASIEGDWLRPGGRVWAHVPPEVVSGL